MIWAAFTHNTSRPASSSRLYTGFEYTPSDSIARIVTTGKPSQSLIISNSSVIVGNVLTRLLTSPSGWVVSARYHRLLTDVQPATSLVNRLHIDPLQLSRLFVQLLSQDSPE